MNSLIALLIPCSLEFVLFINPMHVALRNVHKYFEELTNSSELHELHVH